MQNGRTHQRTTTGDRLLRENYRCLERGLHLLLCAQDYARSVDEDIWHFALEIDELRRAGLTNNEFRWLIANRFVDHARETTHSGDTVRIFCRHGELALCPETCFILTDVGLEAAQKLRTDALKADDSSQTRVIARLPHENSRSPGFAADSDPVWDGRLRELRVCGRVVKRFKWRALNQEVVLAAFEEDGWPLMIDDPLPPHPNQNSKRRLHDTIKCLNRNQLSQLIRFHGDGTGEGVRWKAIAGTPNVSPDA